MTWSCHVHWVRARAMLTGLIIAKSAGGVFEVCTTRGKCSGGSHQESMLSRICGHSGGSRHSDDSK